MDMSTGCGQSLDRVFGSEGLTSDQLDQDYTGLQYRLQHTEENHGDVDCVRWQSVRQTQYKQTSALAYVCTKTRAAVTGMSGTWAYKLYVKFTCVKVKIILLLFMQILLELDF